MRYSVSSDPDTTARAILKEADISPKHAVEICNAIKGKELKEAKKLLEDVGNLKRAIPFKKYVRGVAHRPGKGFGPGRYPQKAAKSILKLLEDCESNAEYSGLNTDALKIKHIVAHRGKVTRGSMPRAHGRATDWDIHTTNVEVILEETEGDHGE